MDDGGDDDDADDDDADDDDNDDEDIVSVQQRHSKSGPRRPVLSRWPRDVTPTYKVDEK